MFDILEGLNDRDKAVISGIIENLKKPYDIDPEEDRFQNQNDVKKDDSPLFFPD